MNSCCREREIPVSQLIFYLWFVILLLTKGLGLVDGPVYKGAIVLAVVLSLVKIAAGRYTRRQLLFIAVLYAAAFLSYRSMGNLGPLFVVMGLTVLQDVDVRKAFSFGAVLWTFCMVLQILSQLLWLRPRDFMIHDKYGLGFRIRWALGYSHPNVLQVSFVVLCAYWLLRLLPSGKRLLRFLVLSCAGAAYIFLYSISITGMLFFVLFALLLIAGEMQRRKNPELKFFPKWEKMLVQLVFPLCAGVSILGPVVLKGRAFDLLNRLMNTRPELARFFLTNYALHPFGYLDPELPAHYTLDCSYVNLLVFGGYVNFVLIAALYLLAVHRIVREKVSVRLYAELAILISFFIAGMSEPFLFNTAFKNVTVLLAGARLFPRSENGIRLLRWGNRDVTMKLPAGPGQGFSANLRPKAENALPGENCEGGDVLPRDEGPSGVKELRTPAKILPSGGENRTRKEGGFAQRFRKQLVCLAGVSAMLGMLAAYGLFREPDVVYALRIYCDSPREEMVSSFLTPAQAEEIRTEGGWVLHYVDEEEPLVEFRQEGLLHLETLRATVSGGVWTALLVTGTAVIVLRIREGRRDRKKCELLSGDQEQAMK